MSCYVRHLLSSGQEFFILQLHPTISKDPNILKELPKAINQRITDILCNQDVFDAAKITYEQALSKSGFN